MKTNVFALAIFISLCSSVYAADNKSSVPTIQPTTAPEQKVNITGITLTTVNPTSHKDLLFTVTTSGSGKCSLRVEIVGPMFGGATDGFIEKMAVGSGQFYAPAGTAKVMLTASGPGIYVATANAHTLNEPKCSGHAEHRFIVSPPKDTPPPATGKTAPDTPEKPCKTPGKVGVGKDCAP